jgi:serine/threonine protein kinase/tetratricopeptide (TPR) repeat protein
MVAEQTCPDQSRLESMLEGTLPPDDQTVVSLHLERCPMCQRKFEELADAGRLLPETELRGQGDAESALMQVMQKLANEGPEAAAQRDTTPNDEPSLPFLAPSESPEHLGRLGPYDVVGVIGQGGMGVVLKARDTRLNRFVAIKVLAPQLAAYSGARKRFLREAQAAAALNHDNVVTIHDVNEFDGFPYIVMEYVVGVSLAERTAGGRALGLAETLRIGSQIAAGLAAAHAQGLIHRDIKPANILLQSPGEKVKITDFGLARAVGEAQITHSGQITGTPEFMSPEQARGEDLDQRSDLFSLGCVLYAMCSGQSPFRSKTSWDALGRVCNEEPRPLREINPQTPGWLIELIKRLLAKNPRDRIQSAAEVAALLARRLVEQGGSPIPPSELTLPAVRRRKPRPVAAVALLMLAVGLGVGIYEIVIRLHNKDRETVLSVPDGSVVKINGNQVDVTPPQKSAEGRRGSDWIKTLKRFQVSDALITKDGVNVDGDAWRIEAKENRVVRLFEVAEPGIEHCRILYRAKLKTESLVGRAYLEMWCRAPVGAEAFSKGLNCTVAGTTDWASYEIPFVFEKGESADLVKLNVVIEGKGTLWIKDVELVKTMPPKSESKAATPGSDDPVELTRQGWARWQKGEATEAIPLFEKAVKLAPKNDIAWNGLGWANFSSGHTAEAEEAFNRSVAINPHNGGAQNGLGQLYLGQRKYDQAEVYFLKAGPGATAAWYGLARLYLLEGKFDKAEKWAQKLVDVGQADEGAKEMLKAAKDKRLSDDLRQLIEPPPAESTAVVALADRGWAHWSKGETTEALPEFELAVRLDPKNQNAWNGLGWTNFRMGKMAEAKEAFERAVALNPRHPGAQNGLGQISLRQRKYDEAEAHFLKAGPLAPAAWYGLASLYLLQGKFDKAEKWAQKVVDSGQADEVAKQMLKAAKDKHLSDELRQLIELPLRALPLK